MKKKAIVISIVAILCIASMLTVVNAQTPNKACAKSFAVGAGVFLHDESGVIHKHYFDFSVFDTNKKNGPEGTCNLVCVHGKQIAMIIKSDDITSFSVESVKRGLEATFTGSATVKMEDGQWQEGWSYIVTAFDSNGKSRDTIGITLFDPSDQVHCTMEPTPIASGNIAINK
jgi:uncharacterized secreted protein with C-terminal beta-propeller domain